MGKMIVLQGLPASGKSTVAVQMVRSAGGPSKLVRVNKDNVRKMLMGEVGWDNWFKHEDAVVQVETMIVRSAIEAGRNVIIDDTNFSSRHLDRWKQMAKQYGYEYEPLFIDTTIEECIRRDALRTGYEHVGKDVILNMAWTAGLLKQTKPWVGCDLDGTLADCTERRLRSVKMDGKLDYGIFLDPKNVWLDKVRWEVWEQVQKYAKENGAEIILLSGRSAKMYTETAQWLEINGIGYDRLIMRPSHDYRPDAVAKLEMLDKYTDGKPLRIYDDRPCMIRAWQNRGIEVIDVGDGKEF